MLILFKQLPYLKMKFLDFIYFCRFREKQHLRNVPLWVQRISLKFIWKINELKLTKFRDWIFPTYEKQQQDFIKLLQK